MPLKAPKNWTYTGDQGIRYGGTYMDLTDPDAIEVVQITDLDSAIGWTDANLIETGTIYLTDTADEKAWNDRLSVLGYKWTPEGIDIGGGEAIEPWGSHFGLILGVEAHIGYSGLEAERRETVIIGKDAEPSHRGWNHDTRLRARSNLRNYVIRNYLRS